VNECALLSVAKKDELDVSGEDCGVKQDSSDDDFRLYSLSEQTFSTVSFSVYLHTFCM